MAVRILGTRPPAESRLESHQRLGGAHSGGVRGRLRFFVGARRKLGRVCLEYRKKVRRWFKRRDPSLGVTARYPSSSWPFRKIRSAASLTAPTSFFATLPSRSITYVVGTL